MTCKRVLHDFFFICLARLKNFKLLRKTMPVEIAKLMKLENDPKSHPLIYLFCVQYKILELPIYAHIKQIYYLSIAL